MRVDPDLRDSLLAKLYPRLSCTHVHKGLGSEPEPPAEQAEEEELFSPTTPTEPTVAEPAAEVEHGDGVGLLQSVRRIAELSALSAVRHADGCGWMADPTAVPTRAQAVDTADARALTSVGTLREVEAAVVQQRLEAHGWVKARTARSLGVNVKTLYNLIHRYRIRERGSSSPLDQPSSEGGDDFFGSL